MNADFDLKTSTLAGKRVL